MEKIYFNALWCKKSKYGVKLSGKADEVIKLIQQHTNSSGYINLELLEKKTPSEKGHTHYVTVDTWEPGNKTEETESVSKNDLPF